MTVAVQQRPQVSFANGDPTWAAHRFTVDDYHRMLTAGILTTDSSVELLDGLVVEKARKSPPRCTSICRLLRILNYQLPDEWIPSPGMPITLAASEPEPDMAIIVGPHERYYERHPGPRDVGVVAEVADESLVRERSEKAVLYAQARIAEYWIVNLVDKVIEVYSHPKSGRQPAYKNIVSYRAPQSVPLVLAGKTIATIPVKEILP